MQPGNKKDYKYIRRDQANVILFKESSSYNML